MWVCVCGGGGSACLSLHVHLPPTHRLPFRMDFTVLTGPLPALVPPPQLESHVRPCRREPPHCSAAESLAPGSVPGLCISRALAPSPGHLGPRSAKFPGFSDSHFHSPEAFGVPPAWCPPHRFSMVADALSVSLPFPAATAFRSAEPGYRRPPVPRAQLV